MAYTNTSYNDIQTPHTMTYKHPTILLYSCLWVFLQPPMQWHTITSYNGIQAPHTMTYKYLIQWHTSTSYNDIQAHTVSANSKITIVNHDN